jgi:hypothetical protein
MLSSVFSEKERKIKNNVKSLGEKEKGSEVYKSQRKARPMKIVHWWEDEL